MREDFQEDAEQGDVSEFSVDDRLIGKRLEKLPGTMRAAPPPTVIPPQRQQYSLVAALMSNLAYTTLIAVIPATAALCATVLMWSLSVVPEIKLVRSSFLGAESTYHRELESSERVLAELGSLGAAADQLVPFYFAFADARGDEARKLADIYYGAMLQEYAQTGPEEHRSSSLPALLAPADSARRLASMKYAMWMSLLDSPRGRIASRLQAAPMPTAGMAIYVDAHPGR